MKKIKTYFVPSEENDYRPGIFRGVSTFVFLLIIFGTLLGASIVSVVVEKSGLLSAIYPAVLVDLTNETRIDNNLDPLITSPDLERVAQLKADHMAENGYFAHNSPDGVTPWYWFGVAGYKFIYGGENLAIDFADSVDVNAAWLNSPGHRENILNSNFTEVGIATAEGTYDGHATVFVVQTFGTPAPVPDPVATSVFMPVSKSVATDIQEQSVELLEQKESAEQKFISVESVPPVVVVEPVLDMDPISDVENINDAQVLQGQAPGYEKYTSWYEWILLNPTKIAEYVLYAISLLIAIAFFMMILIHHKVQRPRNMLYGALVIFSIIISVYANETKAMVRVLLDLLPFL